MEGLSLPAGIGMLAAIALISFFVFLFTFLKIVPIFDTVGFSSWWNRDPIGTLLGHIGGWILLFSLAIFSFFCLFFLAFGYQRFKGKYPETTENSPETKRHPVLTKVEQIFRGCQKRANLKVPTRFIVLGKKEKETQDFSGCAITGKGNKEIALLLGEDFLYSFDKGILNEKEVRAALCHETAHILQRDHLLPLLAMELNHSKLIPLFTWGIGLGLALFATAIQRLVDFSFVFYVLPIVMFFFFIRYICFLAIARGMQGREYMADQEALVRFGIPVSDLSSMIKKMALLQSSGINASLSLSIDQRAPESKESKDKERDHGVISSLGKGATLLKQVFTTQVAYHPPLRKRLAMLRLRTGVEKERQNSAYVIRSSKDILVDGILWPGTLNAIIASAYVMMKVSRSYIPDMSPYETAIFSIFWLNVGAWSVGEMHLVCCLDVQAVRSKFFRNWLALLMALEWRRIHLNNFIRVLITSGFVTVLGLGSWLRTLSVFFLFTTMSSISFALLACVFGLMKSSSPTRRDHG